MSLYELQLPDGYRFSFQNKKIAWPYIEKYMDRPLMVMKDFGFWNLHGYVQFNEDLHTLAKQIIDDTLDT
jgi:hypothetical protein